MGKISNISKRKYTVKKADGNYEQYKFETAADLVNLKNGSTLDQTNFTEVIALKLSGGADIVSGDILSPIPFSEPLNPRSTTSTDYAKVENGRIYALKEGWYQATLMVSISDGGQQAGDWNTAILSHKSGVEKSEYENYNLGGPKQMKASAGGLVYLNLGDFVYGYLKNPWYTTKELYRLDGKETKIVFAPYCLFE